MSKVAVENSPAKKGAAKIVYILYLVKLTFWYNWDHWRCDGLYQ